MAEDLVGARTRGRAALTVLTTLAAALALTATLLAATLLPLSAALLAQQPDLPVGPADVGTPSKSPAPAGATLPAGTPSATPMPLAPKGGPKMIGGDVVRGGTQVKKTNTKVRVRRP